MTGSENLYFVDDARPTKARLSFTGKHASIAGTIFRLKLNVNNILRAPVCSL
jgi:hypothetical protein